MQHVPKYYIRIGLPINNRQLWLLSAFTHGLGGEKRKGKREEKEGWSVPLRGGKGIGKRRKREKEEMALTGCS
jgi:hypothetical protein